MRMIYFEELASSISYVCSGLVSSLVSLGSISSSKSVTMIMDFLRWNILNVVRAELFFNAYKLWDIAMNASFKSPRGQYALASFAITLLAQLTLQFQLTWFLTIYSLYLSAGVGVWLYRRVYFYHRKLDSVGVNQTINHFDTNKHLAAVAAGLAAGATATDGAHYATLKKSSSNHHNHNGTGGGGASSAASSASSTSSNGSLVGAAAASHASSDHTNSLQRQRALAYRDFRSLLTEPRHNHREFALSLAHLSNISKLVASKDVFDEMHFQILATRRDVVNILLRALLVLVSSLLAYVP